ncbi:hypothetical protein EVAR_65010_1 [Eumeta japonica]|uniref:Uncharacterized protein n=1 Tax=Eumeta variegata TaxID=151549 RepID=A0A4C2A6D3_EUMVA|nr:hypothetical protein EVAR_65010_1 [Eumeta japonica]
MRNIRINSDICIRIHIRINQCGYFTDADSHQYVKIVGGARVARASHANDPVVTDSPIMSPAKKPKRMKMRDSLDPEPKTSSTGKKTCLKSDLAMMLDSSSEDEGEGEPDNSSPDDLLRKELVIIVTKKDWI